MITFDSESEWPTLKYMILTPPSILIVYQNNKMGLLLRGLRRTNLIWLCFCLARFIYMCSDTRNASIHYGASVWSIYRLVKYVVINLLFSILQLLLAFVKHLLLLFLPIQGEKVKTSLITPNVLKEYFCNWGNRLNHFC